MVEVNVKALSWPVRLNFCPTGVMPHKLLIQMLKCPGSTGSVIPSSRHLALAMASAATGAIQVIELGAGTGPVTQALLHQCPEAHLTVVELQASLVRHLKATFEQLEVVQAGANVVLDAYARVGPTAIVSSLPFRSLPLSVKNLTIDSIVRFIRRRPGSHLVQFTYHPRAPFPAPDGFRWSRQAFVWRNIPPAGVWVLRPDVAWF